MSNEQLPALRESSGCINIQMSRFLFFVGQALAEKLKEAEEAQKVLQKDCETYKKVLAETVSICLQFKKKKKYKTKCVTPDSMLAVVG